MAGQPPCAQPGTVTVDSAGTSSNAQPIRSRCRRSARSMNACIGGDFTEEMAGQEAGDGTES